jgi:hypothetical protein
MAFYKYDDGLLNSISLLASPKMQTFKKNYTNIKGMIYNARHLDSALLGNISKEEFMLIAADLKESITDNIIEKAVQKFPPAVYDRIGKDIEEGLQSRRNKLPEAAGKYYELLHNE